MEKTIEELRLANIVIANEINHLIAEYIELNGRPKTIFIDVDLRNEKPETILTIRI
jgi:hypothetical protein